MGGDNGGSLGQRSSDRARGLAAAIHFRESRRCPHCGALGYVTCSHRPNGAQGETLSAVEQRMPFEGHRTVAQVWGLAAPGENRGAGGPGAPGTAGECDRRTGHGGGL